MKGLYRWSGAGLVALCACSVGSKDDGFGSAASLGEGEDEGTFTSSVGGHDGGESTDGGGAVTVGGNEGGDPMPPTNPNEDCNGIDDDDNGLVDDGLGEIGCGTGECARVVPACIAGAPNVCEPAAPQVEVCNGLDDDCNGTVDDAVVPIDCSSACGPGTQTCEGGVLTGCNAPAPQPETCNVVDDDCDGSFDEGVGGCRVGVHRFYVPATGEHFYTTSLSEGQNAGFTLESQDFYFLYAAPQPDTIAFNRCYTPGVGMHLYTTAGDCEGSTFEGVMGYIGTSAVADGIPLFRAYNPGTGDHFFTDSQAEYDNAVAGGAYLGEGSVGWVW